MIFERKVAYSSIIGSVLQEVRELKQMKQAEAAAGADMSQSTWARIEVGKACTVENLANACSVLGLELWQLFKVTDERAETLRAKGIDVLYKAPPDEKEEQKEWIINPGVLSTIAIGMLAGAASPAFAAGSVLGFFGNKLFTKESSTNDGATGKDDNLHD